ncbi:competence/damage-inducible protein A [Alicyclobacillaceae bacterium I2511]|nr:competence/damage-inducible protein A [Alicyclobacillaceae bacterium I2511]
MSPICKAEHIGVGTEILLGQIANSHARTISQELAAHGFYMYYHTAVGDNMERIGSVLQSAIARSNVVIFTGGLGPTQDDLTRESVAKFVHRKLTFREDAWGTVERYFHRRRRPIPERNRQQAMVIEGGEWLENPNGTAPGQYVGVNGIHYFLLPGPPLEMIPMLKNKVIPKLQRLFPLDMALESRVLHLCGIGESDVDAQIPELLTGRNPTVAPLAGEGEMLLRVTASGHDVNAAKKLIYPVEQRLRSLFGSYIYGTDEDTLAKVVGQRLLGNGASLAVAESCTGGLVSTMITSIPGSSAYYLGGVVSYADAIKMAVLQVTSKSLNQWGAVSEQVALEMARGVRKLTGSNYGIAITGIAGPSGGTVDKPVGLVWFAISGFAGDKAFSGVWSGSREQIRIRAAKYLLWRLWSQLEMETSGA